MHYGKINIMENAIEMLKMIRIKIKKMDFEKYKNINIKVIV
jgi:hypothetical protein